MGLTSAEIKRRAANLGVNLGQQPAAQPTIPAGTPQVPSLSLWQKIQKGGFNTLGAVAKGLGYATAASLSPAVPLTGLFQATARKLLYGDKTSFKQAYKEGQGQAWNVIKDIPNSLSISDSMKKAGYDMPSIFNSEKKGYFQASPDKIRARDVVREVATLGFDIGADPISYASIGSGSGVKLITKAGKTVTLSEDASKTFFKLVSKGSALSTEDLIKSGVKKSVANKAATKAGSSGMGTDYAKRVFQRLIEKNPEKYIDKGGLKFAGKTIPGTRWPINTVEEKIKSFAGKFARDAKLAKQKDAKEIIQSGRDMEEAASHKYQYGYDKAFKGASSKDKKIVAEYINYKNAVDLGIETPEVVLPSRLKRYYNFVTAENKNIAKEETARGILKSKIDNYVTHYYPDATKEQITKLSPYVNNVAAGTRFSKTRKLALFEQAEALGLKPEKDVQKILTARKMASVRAITKSDMLRELAQKVGQKVNLPKSTGMKPRFEKNKENIAFNKKMMEMQGLQPERLSLHGGEPVSPSPLQLGMGSELKPEKNVLTGTYTNPKATYKATEPLASIDGVTELAGYKLPTSVVDYLINKLDVGAIKSKELNKFLQVYDKALNVIKISLTTLFPQFHNLNAVSNVFQNFLDIGLMATINPKFHNLANEVMAGKNMASIVSVGGKKYTVRQLTNIMREKNILQGIGFFDMKTPKVPNKVNPVYYGQRVGRYIENEARGVNFLANLEKYGNVDLAAEHTKKFLFDYENLSDVEKNFFKRAFPFYTWTSKNLVLQAEQLFKNPGRISAQFKVVNRTQSLFNQTETDKEKQYRNEYSLNQHQIKTGVDKDGNPIYASNFRTPLEAAAGMVADPLGNLSFMSGGSGLGLFRMGLEAKTGYDMNQGRPIADITNAGGISLLNKSPITRPIAKLLGYEETTTTNSKGETVTKATANPYALWILRQPPFSRFYTTSGKFTQGAEPDVKAGLLGSTLGISVRPYKLDDSLYYRANDVAKSKLSKEEQTAYDAAFGKKPDTANTDWAKVAKASNLLAYPQVLDARTQMQLSLAATTGNPVDPLFLLPPEQQIKAITYSTLEPGSKTKSLLIEQEPWLLEFWDTRSKFFNELNSGNPQPSSYAPNPRMEAIQEEYFSYPAGSGERSRFLKQHPELIDYWASQKEKTNAKRATMGLPGLPTATSNYQSSVSSRNRRMQSYRTANLLRVRKTKVAKTPTLTKPKNTLKIKKAPTIRSIELKYLKKSLT